MLPTQWIARNACVASLLLATLPAVWASSSPVATSPSGPVQEATALVITGVTVIDGVSDLPISDATVVIRDGTIRGVYPSGVAVRPADARVIDLGGQWLVPGLIDAHVHLPDFESARRALLSGVTTARSMGTIHFIDVGMRELAAQGSCSTAAG